MEGTPTPKEGEPDELAKIVKQATREDGRVDTVALTKLMDERTAAKIEQSLKSLERNMTERSVIINLNRPG